MMELIVKKSCVGCFPIVLIAGDELVIICNFVKYYCQ